MQIRLVDFTQPGTSSQVELLTGAVAVLGDHSAGGLVLTFTACSSLADNGRNGAVMTPCLLLIFLLLRRIRHLLVCMYVNQRFSYNLLSNKKGEFAPASGRLVEAWMLLLRSVSDEVRVGARSGTLQVQTRCGSPVAHLRPGLTERLAVSRVWQSGRLRSAGFRSGSQALPTPAAKPCPLQGLGSVACYPNVPVSRELLKVQNSSKENVGLAFSSHLTRAPSPGHWP